MQKCHQASRYHEHREQRALYKSTLLFEKPIAPWLGICACLNKVPVTATNLPPSPVALGLQRLEARKGGCGEHCQWELLGGRGPERAVEDKAVTE